ncbi:uncharacterized protein ATNIH1004_007055 [Aspergillus tanneri]|uniref:Uncharacterized protein n=1 Tax=Aspergillus tanneri TaxID=1220188 RepID=A0A5M9MIF7_9EURO|nr:uncharacterized protein ATNIH1004_007055 [Aspergillus tanneri]KAA8645636.1 hypothetical protein ATNIH1004_007055 [Aspergillus tanneri]
MDLGTLPKDDSVNSRIQRTIEMHRVTFKIDRQDISGDTVGVTISYSNSRLEMDVDKWLSERRNVQHISKNKTSVRQKMALNFSLLDEVI